MNEFIKLTKEGYTNYVRKSWVKAFGDCREEKIYVTLEGKEPVYVDNTLEDILQQMGEDNE